MAELDTWEERENLGNTKEAIEEFEKEYRWDMEDIRKQEREEGMFRREELCYDLEDDMRVEEERE